MKRTPVIEQPEGQLTLNFEPGLSDRYKCLRECVASGVYRNGLGNTAIDLDKAPGNLSVELSSDPTRHFSVDSLEKYIEKTGDTQPIFYLIDKFLRNEQSDEPSAAEMRAMLKQFAPAFKRMGVL
jgi:hypothetical protein